MKAAPPSRLGYVAALLAVALLGLAGVRSTLMQAEMAAAPSTADCAMPAMDMGVRDAGKRTPDAPRKTCEFCAAAAHVPVCSSVAVVVPSGTLAWLTWRPLSSLGPRGPPSVEARARGPPDLPLNA